MASLPAIPPTENNNPPSPPPVPPVVVALSSPPVPAAAPPPAPDGYEPIVGHCIVFAVPTVLGFLMLIFLGIPAVMPPEFGLDPGSSLSSHNISTSDVTTRWNMALSIKNPSTLIAVKYIDMKLLLSFGGELSLSCPSHIPAFTQGPCNITTVRAKALSVLLIINDLGIKDLVHSLQGGVVTIDVVVKAKRRLHLGPWLWVPMFDVYFSCMDVAFTAPNNSEGGSDWMILRGNLQCEPDIFTVL